jgi:hypothetical protein
VFVVGENNVYETTALAKDAMTKRPVLTKSSVSKLLFVRTEGGVEYLYYFNSANEIAKINLETLENEIRISDNSANSTWFAPELITIDGADYLFYCDNSLYGKSYIEYVDLATEVDAEDTDEDDEDDLFFLKEDAIKSLGKMSDGDRASIVAEKIKALTLPEGGIGADAEDDAEFMEEYEKVLAEYDALGSIKSKVSDAEENKIANIKKALEVIEKYKELDGIDTCVDVEEAEALGLREKYEQVKTYLKNFKDSSSIDAVDEYIAENLKANYTKAVEMFED